MYMYTVTRRIYCTVAVRCILRVLWLDFELVVGTSVVAWRRRERHQRLLRCRRERRRGTGGRSAHVYWGWVLFSFAIASFCDNVVTTYSGWWRHAFWRRAVFPVPPYEPQIVNVTINNWDDMTIVWRKAKRNRRLNTSYTAWWKKR